MPMPMPPLFLLFILLYTLQVDSRLPSSSDQNVLIALKLHWNDPTSLDSWAHNSSLPRWPQVEVDPAGFVTNLYLSRLNLFGSIPPSICLLDRLSWIDLSGNFLSGNLPVCLYNVSTLQRLDLSSNSLSGEIPPEYSLMESLVWLDLSDNYLTGPIPKGLLGMDRLFSLALGHNNLSGPLPEQLGPSSLRVLNLTRNRFIGSVSSSVGVFYNLSTLDLSDNELSGDVLDIVTRLNSIGSLRLCSNGFSGMIPYEFLKSIYDHCLDSANLCSDGKQSCSSGLCSISIFHNYLKCENDNPSSTKPKSKSKPKIVVYILGVGFGVIGFALFYFMSRKRETIRARIKSIWQQPNPEANEVDENNEEWKMISFQKSKMNKIEIVMGLTEENLIGAGGSGKVYRVPIDQQCGSVAVKSLSSSGKLDSRVEKEFLAEIRTLGVIRHYNIIKLLAYISGHEVKLLVYQYFENQSLDKWLHGDNPAAKLDWPTRMKVAIGIGEGLCYMHHYCTPPIIHRDIKPSNILLDAERNAKIADFGLAKLINRLGETETASAVAGTFGYMAPEYVYRGKVNRKSDVYSFGVVLLEMTTGRKAVAQGEEGNLADWAQVQIRDTSVFFDGEGHEFSGSEFLDQIVSVFRLGVMCTAKLPGNRPCMKDCLRILHTVNESSKDCTQTEEHESSSM